MNGVATYNSGFLTEIQEELVLKFSVLKNSWMMIMGVPCGRKSSTSPKQTKVIRLKIPTKNSVAKK
jgi:hypothetical protein